MEIPSITLGTDSLGLGQTFGSLFSATGTAECGSKPTCIGWTKTCKEKNEAYAACRMKALEVQGMQQQRNAVAPTETTVPASNQRTFIIIGIVILILLIIGFAMRNRNNAK